MTKLTDKANEVNRDFETLSAENKARVIQNTLFLALIKLGEGIND